MSHDTHTAPANTKPGSSFTSSIWFMLIIGGLFIAAVNFVDVMGHHEEGGHDGGHSTEHTAPAADHGDAHGTEHAEHTAPATGHDEDAHGHEAEEHAPAH